jgi:predicted O-methyltransferase YrrM
MLRQKSVRAYQNFASLCSPVSNHFPRWSRNSIVAKWGRFVAPAQNIWYRASYVRGYYWLRARPALRWLIQSRETSNFTYDLTSRNEEHLTEILAVALKLPSSEIARYIAEIRNDVALKNTIIERARELEDRSGIDVTARFGRRVGWYAVARALKPRVVVETGVEKGLGAVVLCAALLRNAQDGHPGRYYGTDIDRRAGVLWTEPYRSTGEILYGDSIESLTALDATIDLFINDSDHSAQYEGREYRTVEPKLSEHAVIIGDNAHVTDELLRFSRSAARHFLFFREEPADHWYLGAGIGLSFK